MGTRERTRVKGRTGKEMEKVEAMMEGRGRKGWGIGMGDLRHCC